MALSRRSFITTIAAAPIAAAAALRAAPSALKRFLDLGKDMPGVHTLAKQEADAFIEGLRRGPTMSFTINAQDWFRDEVRLEEFHGKTLTIEICNDSPFEAVIDTLQARTDAVTGETVVEVSGHRV